MKKYCFFFFPFLRKFILRREKKKKKKVGAALSMTYITGRPVYFVGTGQTYVDLKQMNIAQIVDTLLAKV